MVHDFLLRLLVSRGRRCEESLDFGGQIPRHQCTLKRMATAVRFGYGWHDHMRNGQSS